MPLQTTDHYIKVCMKAWLLCEASVYAEVTGLFPRQNLIKECEHCARACFAVVSGLINNREQNLGGLVLNCLLHCRLCSYECAKHAEEDIQLCGMISSICADTVKEIAIFNLN